MKGYSVDYSSDLNYQGKVPPTVSRKLSSCLAASIAAVTMLSAFDAEAVDVDTDSKKRTKKTAQAGKRSPSVAELQAQVELLNQQLLASKQREIELIKKGSVAVNTVAGAAPTADAAAAQRNADELALAEAEAALAAAKPKKKEEEVKNLGEVVVRSRQRIEKLQDVPLSVSVVTGQQLEREQAMDLGAITKRAANVEWNQGNQRTSSLSIRGIGKMGQTEAQDPTVGMIVDGVNYAFNPMTSSYDFVDVDSVEVTRGPQGTLKGKGSNMGLVEFTTKRPIFNNTADYSFTYGNYDSYIAKGALNGVLVDDLIAVRSSFVAQKQRGFMTNTWNQDSTFQNIDRLSGRTKVLFTPSSKFNALLSVNIQPNTGESTNGGVIYSPTPVYSNTGNAITSTTNAATRLGRSWFVNSGINNSSYASYLGGIDGQNAIALNSQQPITTGTQGASLEMNWDVLNHNLTSISAYQGYHFNASTNDDGTPFAIATNNGGYSDYYSQLSQEIRFNNKVGGPIDYTGGIYLLQVENKTAYNKSYGSDAGAWYASNAQYTGLDANASGQLLMQNSLNNLWLNTNAQDIQNQSEALFGQSDFHITDKFTLTTGFRATNEHRVNPNSSYVVAQGSGALLNPYEVNTGNGNPVVLGGINLDGSGNLLAPGSGQTVAQETTIANNIAQQYFGVTAAQGGYSALTTAQKQEVAYAQQIRTAQMGALWSTQKPTWNSFLPSWNLSPKYKFDENHTGYLAWQHGAKAGAAQSFNGNYYNAGAEYVDNYEIGLKSTVLDKTLVLNGDLYWSDIHNYQMTVPVYNTFGCLSTGGTISGGSCVGGNPYSSVLSNVPLVRTAGVELDGVYSGIQYTNIRFSASYTDAIYAHFNNAGYPTDIQVGAQYGTPPSGWNASGQSLPGANKWNFNISPEIRIPSELLGIDFLPGTEVHTSLTESYLSRYNSDTALSNYAWIPYQFNTDFSFGIGRRDKSLDISFVSKNLLNNHTPVLQTLNSYTPAYPQWLGIQLSGKF